MGSPNSSEEMLPPTGSGHGAALSCHLSCRGREHTQIYPNPGWVEHDPEEIWEAIQKAVAGVLKDVGATAAQVVSIGIDNQGETCMVWDKNTGKPVHNALVWQETDIVKVMF